MSYTHTKREVCTIVQVLIFLLPVDYEASSLPAKGKRFFKNSTQAFVCVGGLNHDLSAKEIIVIGMFGTRFFLLKLFLFIDVSV